MKYLHAYNTTDLSKPYSIHALDAQGPCAVLVNGLFIGQVNPNIGTLDNYTAWLDLSPIKLAKLITYGSGLTYTDHKISNAIFNSSTFIYIKNLSGLYLAKDTQGYYWSSSKTKFFFNPYVFKAKYLWIKLFGYVPSSVPVIDLWQDSIAIDLFSKKEIILDLDWQNYNSLEILPTDEIGYFNTTGLGVSFAIDRLLDIPELKYGDTLEFIYGGERLSIDYKPTNNHLVKIDGLAMPNQVVLQSNGPIVHLEVDCIQPNKKILFSKVLHIGLNQFSIDILGESYNIEVDCLSTDITMSNLIKLFSSDREHIIKDL